MTVKVMYDKLQGVEPEVSRAMVRETAGSMTAIIQKMRAPDTTGLPRYRTKILDGNHLRRTQRRITELRGINVAPLPGQALVVLDPQLRLAIDVFPCEDRELHILTNLPQHVTAVRVAELYRSRWTIETAFQELAQNLHGEVVTLGYPKAALFAFCMALLSYNIWSVMRAAQGAAHGEEKIQDEFSVYYLADEVHHTYRATDIIPDSYWSKRYAHLSPAQMARELIRIARTVHLPRYRKHKRGPKKPRVKMKPSRRNHVSTARILAESRAVPA